MNKIKALLIMIALMFLATSAHAELLYSKPEFRGRVIDSETKEPIEGVVAVVLYDKRPLFIPNPGGTSAYAFKAKETLTDKKGEFYLSSYSSLILFSEDAGVRFVFFKPGYKTHDGDKYNPFCKTECGPVYKSGCKAGGAKKECVPLSYMDPTLTEKYFSSDVIGKVNEIQQGSFEKGNFVKWKGPLGIVELEKGEHDPSTPTGYSSNELPLLFKALNEDRKNRGYKGELK